MVTKNNTVKRCKFMIKKLLETPFNRLNMFMNISVKIARAYPTLKHLKLQLTNKYRNMKKELRMQRKI